MGQEIPLVKKKKMKVYRDFTVNEVETILKSNPMVIEKTIEKKLHFLGKVVLEKKVKGMFGFGDIHGRSKPMQYIYH